MTAEQKLDHLRKIAEQHPRTCLSKALRELADENIRDTTRQLRAAVEARRDAVRMQTMAGCSEGLL
jgi:hypothetical protein